MIRLLPILARTIAVMALALVVCSGRANAGCGEPMLTLEHARADSQELPAKPCHGPNCSALPDRHQLPNAPSLPSSAPSSEWAIAILPFDFVEPIEGQYGIPASRGRAEYCPAIPFHPPRSH